MATIVAAGIALVAVLVWLLFVPRIAIDEPDAPEFARLVTPASTALLGAIAFTLGHVLLAVPRDLWWLWAPYLAFGVPLVAVDALTTFLPARLNYATLAAMACGGIGLTLTSPWLAVASCVGALTAGGLFFLAWRVGTGLGFGDVRLAFLIGALAGPGGPMGVAGALVAGTALGAMHAVAHTVWARRDAARPRHFPYGPALFAGPPVAAVAAAIAG